MGNVNDKGRSVSGGRVAAGGTGAASAPGSPKPERPAAAIRKRQSIAGDRQQPMRRESSRRKSLHQKTRPKPHMSASQKEMIRGNWDSNRRHDLCRRIYGRAFNLKPEMRLVFERMGAEVWAEEAQRFGDFVESAVRKLDDFAAIEQMSLELGRRHGDWRQDGFKSEFWVAFAEAMTKECVRLDCAAHPPGEVLEAWSTLIGYIFDWVRDGYYEKLRVQRRISRRLKKSVSQSSCSLSNSSLSNSMEEALGKNCAAPAHLPAIIAADTPVADSFLDKLRV